MRRRFCFTIMLIVLTAVFALPQFSVAGQDSSKGREVEIEATLPAFQGYPIIDLPAGASCTNLGNWQCVETRPGLSLCRANNICVVKVDLNRNTLRPKAAIASGGGTEWLSSIASRNSALAAINGDYFSGCPRSPNCGEGLTFVDSQDLTDYTGNEWQNRRSLGFNDSYDPHIGWPSEQGSYHRQLLGGGPQVTFGGEFRWRCWYQGSNTEGNCSCQNNTVVINDEQFGCSANNWWNREQTFVGFSDDGNTLFLAVTEPGVSRTPHQVHDVLWSMGSRHAIKQDGGGSTGMYFNDGGYSFTWNGGRAVANAWVIVVNNDPPPTCSNLGPNEVAVYVDPDHRGTCQVRGIGEYRDPGAIGIPNDSMSSIRVGSNVKAILYENDGFNGRQEPFTGDDSNLGDNSIGNDSVSSMKVQERNQCNPGADEVAVYVDPDHRGTCQVRGINDYRDPGAIGIPNDSMSSIRVGGNVKVILYEHADYSGREETLTGDDSNLGDNPIGNDSVSSMKVQRRVSPPTANFDASPLSGFAPLTVTFHDTSQGEYNSCHWDYGDGSTLDQCHGSRYHNHPYTSPGSYTVSLTVTGPGGQNVKTLQNYVTVQASIPSTPQIQAISNPEQDGAYRVTWTVSPGATSYELQDRVNSGSWVTAYTGAATSKDFSGRVAGTWCYRVRASNSSGASAYNDPPVCTTVVAPPTCSQFYAEYYNNRTLSGNPTFTRCDVYVAWDWGSGGPGNGVGSDNFSVRWKGQFNFSGGNTRFIATADDGVRVWIDGVLLIDAWRDQAPTEYRGERSLSAGTHEVKVEYYENGGWAIIGLRWEAGTCPDNQYRAEYFNNRTLSGNPIVVRCEPSINYDWGSGSPMTGVTADNFSVRWTGRHSFSGGNTRFIATADDGVRVWVDGSLLIEGWHDQAPTEYHAVWPLSAGTHEVKVEYYENGVGAVAKLRWEGVDVCPDNQYRAEYFNNRTLSGSPAVVRCEPSVNYDWGSGSPVAGIGADNFSVRWTGRHSFGGGNTRFIATADDGIQVWVDGALLIDAWRDQAPTEYRGERSLSAGTHEVKVLYYENGGGAVAKLRWEAGGVCPDNQYRAEYFNNRTLSGNPVVVRCESSINYDWGSGSPVAGIGAENFSVRWTGRHSFSGGNTRFIATADDGIRVWVDGSPLIDAWHDQGPTEYRGERSLSAGTHEVKVEYYENGGGAVAKLRWEAGTCPDNQYRAEYFNNRTLSGNPVVIRCESSINYDWGGGSPVAGIGAENFSVRWTGRHSFSGGNTRFIAIADDGIRVWVDGSLLIDGWRDQGPTEYRGERSLSAGTHEVKAEYYENGGGAVAKLRWE